MTVNGLPEAFARLREIPVEGKVAIERALDRMARLVHRDARRNAPRSPSAKIIRLLRKTKRKTKRNARATSRASPGGLERSIEFAVDHATQEAAVFVAANGEAAQYAYFIHEQKNMPGGWSERGPGTVQKGPQADDKFITRAATDNEKHLRDILENELEKALKRFTTMRPTA